MNPTWFRRLAHLAALIAEAALGDPHVVSVPPSLATSRPDRPLHGGRAGTPANP